MTVCRSCALAGVLVVGWASAAPGNAPRDRDVLARAGAFVRGLEEELPRVVARERMVQRATVPGGGPALPVSGRRMVSELAWVPMPEAPDLLPVRDVVEVDGRALTSERQRLQALLQSGRGALEEARRLLNEGARYNLAPGSRNFNLPTVALFFLHPDTAPRFSWSRTSPRKARIWTFEFKERERPTIIRDGSGRPVFSRGSVDIDAATGTVRRTALRLRYHDVNYTLVTTFEPVPTMGLVLPVRMDERYATSSGLITSAATYDDYRRFETGARLVQ